MQRFANVQKNTDVSKRELENKEVSYRAALESIVLLKNDGALPLKEKKIALYGAGVSQTIKGGSGSGEVNERHPITILEGMQNAGFEITSMPWIEAFEKECQDAYVYYKKHHRGLISLINSMANPFTPPAGKEITDEEVKASDCDTAIYVVSRQAGEGADKKIEKGEFDLQEIEINSIKKMAKSYKNSILVINSGSYMSLSTIDDVNLSAIIFFCQQGQEGGRAFADLVSGKVSPSGKLTDSWAKDYKDIPYADEFSYRNGDTKNEYYHEGIYVGYRYYDTYKVEPRYHFGFGLSYTTFDIKTVAAKLDGMKVSLDVEVTNTGNYAGKEVVQVYSSAPAGELPKEYQRLVAYKKTKELKPGEKQTLTIEFCMCELASYKEATAEYLLEKGDYILRVGNASNNTTPGAVITLDETAVTEKLTNICKIQSEFEELAPVTRENEDSLDAAFKLEMKAADVKTKVVEYKDPEIFHSAEVDEIMAKLNNKEKATVCCGMGFGGMMSTDKLYTPGAVGRSTDKFYDKGLINVSMADGPAGLRLLRESAITPKGKLKFVRGSYLMSFWNTMPEFILKFVLQKEGRDEKMYQYCTSFPVGTSIAQTWNEELCEEIGAAVSKEMDEYNITYWLAPALNIHRNPLCGRNFEYYSEDPVVSGKTAAAITRGVHTIPGNYTTIKHFACNNQEDNRNNSNSRVHERALREIYLKGFEICVKESQVKSVMTSYNLVNGIYTPDSYDLCTKALRNEWGFEGVVMTDWSSTVGGHGDTAVAVSIGNDYIMPGGGGCVNKVAAGVKKGVITQEQLDRACANIIRSVVESNVAKRIKPDMFNEE